MMQCFIITEAGKEIGYGHVVRCMSLYEAFETKGVSSCFIVKGDRHVEQLLKGKNWVSLDWLENGNELLSKISNSEVVVLDSYLADSSFYRKIAKIVKKPIYVDDANRIDFPRGIVVNGGIFAKELPYKINWETQYLLGTKYSLLRSAFGNVPNKVLRSGIEKIMVTFGGDDMKNATPQILHFLNETYKGVRKCVVVGMGFQNINEIEEASDETTELIYAPDAQKMLEVMLDVDITISAGGYTLYELACVGVPTIGVCITEHQVRNLVGWQKKGFIEYVGWYNDKNVFLKIKKAIRNLSSHSERIKRSKIAKKLVDGQGAKRCIQKIIN